METSAIYLEADKLNTELFEELRNLTGPRSKAYLYIQGVSEQGITNSGTYPQMIL